MIGLDQGLWKNYEMVKKDGNLKTLERTLNIERFSAMEQLEIVGDCFPKMIFRGKFKFSRIYWHFLSFFRTPTLPDLDCSTFGWLFG